MRSLKSYSPKAWLILIVAILIGAVTVLLSPLFHQNEPTYNWEAVKGQMGMEKISVACFPVRLPSLVWYNLCVW